MAMNASCLTFVTNADWASLFAMEIEKSCEWLNYNFVWDQESKLSAPGETNNVSETFFFLKVTHNKTVWLTSFQVQEFQSVTIFFKFVHQFLLLFSLCYLYLLLGPVYMEVGYPR